MLSLVTTVTIAATTSSDGQWLTLIAAILLVLLLMQKERSASAANEQTRALSQVLNVAIFPLLITFGVVIVLKLTAGFL